MRIQKISVKSLFGIFDHLIPLNVEERMTIIHGPNGFGKTAILRILNGFFNHKYSELRAIPFRKFQIYIDDSFQIIIIKNEDNLDKSKKSKIHLEIYQDDLKIDDCELKEKEIHPSLPDILDEIVAPLQRIRNGWLYLPTRAVLSLEEAVERFADILPPEFILPEREPEFLQKLRDSIQISFIESQRLLNSGSKSRMNANNFSHRETRETVSAYSNELAKLMQEKFKEYGTISQSLDRTYPVRVVKQQPSLDLTDDELREQLNQLEQTRSRLIQVGLLEKDENSEFQIQPQDIDESTKNALSIYVEDVQKKLSVFNDIANKIFALGTIINKKFDYSYKKINFSKDQGFIFTSHYNGHNSALDKTLSPSDLSSGEQHELVLFYELLFKVKPNSLVLIDEPELSLHVGWQVEFLKDLQEIIELADLDILMATHSPDIIQDRWNLTVELKRPEL